MPEARPDSLSSTSIIAASRSGLKAMPAPRPSSSMPGSTSTTMLPSTGATREQRQPDRGAEQAEDERLAQSRSA